MTNFKIMFVVCLKCSMQLKRGPVYSSAGCPLLVLEADSDVLEERGVYLVGLDPFHGVSDNLS